MCVAPDYLLVHHSVKDKLLNAFKEVLPKFFGDKPEDSYNYGKIINEKQFNRIAGYLSTGTKIFGGRTDKEKLFIEPTILTEAKTEAMAFIKDTMDEAKAIIDRHPNPLSFYIYTSNSIKEKEWLDAVPSGGSCVNNSSWHLTNHNLPFGGRGFSGTGCYHGKYSFDTFSHKKAVMKTPTWFDPSIKYPPFKGKLKLFKWVIR